MRQPAMCVLLAVLSCMAVVLWAGEDTTKPEVAIAKMFGIRTSTYYVEIDTKGQLKNLCATDQRGGLSAQLLKELWIPREDFLRVKKMSIELTGMTQTSKNKVEVVLAGVYEKTKDTVPESFKIFYTFEDTEIRIRVNTKPGLYMGFEIGENAQIAQNLNNSKEMALPPLPGVRVGVLQSMKVTYVDATELLFRWTGPGNPLNVNENGGIGAWRRTTRIIWGMRGMMPHSEYNLTFRVVRPERPGKVLAAPQFTIKTPVPGAIFFRQEEPQLTLEFARQDYQRILDLLGGRSPERTQIEYRVTDQHGQKVDKGAMPIDFAKDGLGQPDGLIAKTIALKPGKLGYFDASFRVVDGRRVFRSVWKERPLSVVEALKNPEEERVPMTQGRGWDGYDRNAFIGFGLIREIVDMRVAPEKGKFVWSGREKHFQRVKERRETTGVNAHFMLFHGSGVTWAKTPQDMFEVYKAILERYKDYNKNWETLNEPNIVFKPKEYLEMYLKPLKLAAEKIDPEANVIGFSMCGFGLDFIEEVYKLGGKDYFDAISIHPYIGTPYDLNFVGKIRELKRLTAKYGDEGKPIWFTEGGFGWWNLASQTDRARHNVRRILIQDQYGIPKERDFYYFTTAHGYHRFYVMERDGALLPQAVAMRAMKVRLDGAKYERHFGFGLRFAHCNVYKAKDRQIAVLWTYDNSRMLELKIDATEAEGYDMWGNPVELDLKDGALRVSVSGEPTYVVLPVGAKLRPVWDRPGRNVADLAFGAEVTSSSEAAPADLVLDGVWEGGGWRDGTRKQFPDWIEVELPLPETIDRCHIYASGGSYGGCIRDLDMLGLVDGKYVKLAQVRGNLDAILDLKFKPVKVKKVKFDILAGPPNSDWTIIHEIELFAAGKKDETKQEMVNWALAKNGGKATASSVWKLETEYPEAAPNRGPNFAVSDRRVKVTVEYKPEQAIDGNFMPNRWQQYIETVWIDGTPKQFPDWLQVDFDGPKTINAVLVFVNNFSRYRPVDTGLSDCDLLVWGGGEWRTAGSVSENRKGVISFALKEPAKTDKIRVVCKDSNDHVHSTIMEIQALGPRE